MFISMFPICLNVWLLNLTGILAFTLLSTCVQDKFISTLEVIVRKTSSQCVTVDSMWVSEKEMREELKWSAYLV